MNTDDRRKAAAALGPIILYGEPSMAEIAKARGGGRGVLVLPEEMRERLLTDDGQEIDMDQPAPDLDPEQHFGHEGYFDGEGPVDSVSDEWAGETTMAEEPIEDRLRRQWLNGYMMGFREGFERAGWLDR